MTDKKKKQILRYTDEELSLIKSLFAENEELLKALRKVFLQMPLNVIETTMVASYFGGNKKALALISKTFKPELDPEAPFHQLIDLWMSIDVKDKSFDDLVSTFKARQLLIDLLEQQLRELDGIANKSGFGPRKIELSSLTVLPKVNAEYSNFYPNLIARNTLINHVEIQLTQLLNLAGRKDETSEDTIKRLQQDSTK